MTFVTYSQNFEDVLLWRALGHIKDGFYIDVGANDPELHSVTKAFYDAGWRGINIEPMPSYRAPFEAQRPRDINLTCAAGAGPGELTLFEVPSMNGWASTDAGVAAMHRAQGYEVTETRVPVTTLAAICAEHAPAGIHFLKIDVEGFEGEVLKGMDFERFRPWIVVVEATLPGSRETNHDTWEAMVTGHRYTFAWFDGLNRYYVADEHAELRAALAVQANVFDEFVSHHLVKALAEGKALAEQVASHWQRVEQQAALLKERDTLLDQANAQLQQSDRHASTIALQLQAARQDAALAGQRAGELAEALRVATGRAQEAEQREQAALLRERTLHEQLERTGAWAHDLEARVLAMGASTSWRITAPLRYVGRRGNQSLPNVVRRKAKGAVRDTLRWVATRETMRRVLLPVILRFPPLQTVVSRVMSSVKHAAASPAHGAEHVPAPLREMPQAARTVLADLQRAYQNQPKQ